MKTIKPITNHFPESLKINQERFNEFVTRYIDNNVKLSSYEVKHYKIYRDGGCCPECKEPYKPVTRKDRLSEYTYHEPSCACFIRYEASEKRKKNIQKVVRVAGLPEEFKNVTLSGLDMSGIEEGTKIAIEKVQKYVSNKLYNTGKGCILYGHVGTGKTHMAVSILKHIMTETGCSGKFIHMSDLIKKILHTKRDYTNELLKYKVLCFDDMDKIAMEGTAGPNEWKAEQMYSLFNSLSTNKRIIIGTSNCESIQEFGDKFDTAIISRLAAGCVFVEVLGADYRIIKRGRDESYKL